MSLVGDTVLVTPFYNENDDGVCNLLEIGNATCLLDCGCCNHDSVDLLNRIQLELGKRNKGLDAVIISHADVQHMGALPYILGKNGFRNVEVICTLPVHKFGQMLLYDYCSNRDMEGEETKSSHKSSFDYDDIDMALSSVNVVKFSQKVKITSKFSDSSMSFIAYPSGRTIGGSIWSIQCGSTDVLYTIDLNLRKEVVLDGVSLDLLPTVPSLLIIDSGSTISTSDKISTTSKSHKKEKDDPNKLINSIMETMRSEGNVLLPCETAGHTLEMMQILATYWQNNKLGMYHLIYLSPMAFNVIEFARSQLEWMSDTLSRSFYNGRPNPFELPYMKICTSMSDIERLYPGPKTVLATDSSLSFGFSKEILLRWGGNPLNKVIFTDISVAESLAVELRQQTVPPIIATVTRPVRVQLVGAELEEYMRDLEKSRRAQEEASQRKQRETELELLAEADTDDEDDDDEPGAGSFFNHSTIKSANTSSENKEPATQSIHHGGQAQSRKKRRLSSALVSKFVNPSFPMFETREVTWSMIVDDFGASIDDLPFPTDSLGNDSSSFENQKRLDQSGKLNNSLSLSNRRGDASDVNGGLLNHIPNKIVSTTSKVQFTCSFREIPLAGRADVRAMKTILSKVSPSRVMVIKGHPDDKAALENHAKSIGIEVFIVERYHTTSFKVIPDRLKLYLPLPLISKTIHAIGNYSKANFPLKGQVRYNPTNPGSGTEKSSFKVSSLKGKVMEIANTNTDGVRSVLLVALHERDDDDEQKDILEAGTIDDVAEEPETTKGIVQPTSSSVISKLGHQLMNSILDDESLQYPTAHIYAISTGEVMFNTIKTKLEARGLQVEFKVSDAGAILICNSQVLLRKDAGNDFIIEGPPGSVFVTVRNVLYDYYSFVS